MGILSHGLAMSLAWAVPVLALVAGLMPAERSPLGRILVARCRFLEVPVDDVERLAAWCRENTPRSAMFVGPPGPKTFRLWSRRSLAFNRAGSPYHAAGLADWFARFQDHVDVHSPRPPSSATTCRDEPGSRPATIGLMAKPLPPSRCGRGQIT